VFQIYDKNGIYLEKQVVSNECHLVNNSYYLYTCVYFTPLLRCLLLLFVFNIKSGLCCCCSVYSD
jgi:hypothetical protein